jgi:hypothetical protein
LLGNGAAVDTKECVMPQQKDLKRVVRTRMQKTGESYTAARQQIVNKKEVPAPPPDYAALAGMSDEAVQKQTGRTWTEWVSVLDAWDATTKPHRDAALYVHELGVKEWWSQMVVVGYERIRGLRARGQRREGYWETSKSRTFPVPVSALFAAFSDAKKRAKWLPGLKLKVRTQQPDRSMRLAMDDGTIVELGFTAKSESKSAVAVQHTKLPSKERADELKAFWGARLDALGELLA